MTFTATVLDVRVTNLTLELLAIVITILRLVDRARVRKLWWDDAWAAFAMVNAIIAMTAVELHLQDPTQFSHATLIGIYYMCAQFFYAVLWSARMSILFTIMRLTPPGRTKLFVKSFAWALMVTWVILFAQVWWVCESDTTWKLQPAPQCFLGRNVAIAQVITDVVSDAVLIFCPLQLIWNAKLTRTQRTRIISLFSTSAITTCVSLNHAYWVLRDGGINEALAAVIQDSVSLIVANLPVVVAFFFRLRNDEATSSGAGATTGHPRMTGISAPAFSRLQFAKTNGGQNTEMLTINVNTDTAIIHDDDGLPIKLDNGSDLTFDGERYRDHKAGLAV